MSWALCDADWNHWPDGFDDDAFFDSCRSIGMDGVELGVYRVAEQLRPSRLDRIEALQARTGVPVRGLLLSLPVERWPGGALTGAPDELAGEVRDLARIAVRFGLDTIGLWPGADPLDAPWTQVEAGTRVVAAAAASTGVRVAVEYKPDTAVPDAAAAVALARAVPGVGVLLDTGHAYALGEDPAAVAREVARLGLLWHLHLGDAQPGGADDDLPVGRVHDPVPLVAALAEVGYGGAAALDLYGAVADGGSTGKDAVTESVANLRAAAGR